MAFGQAKGLVSRWSHTWVLQMGLDYRHRSGTHWHSSKTGSSSRGRTVIKKETKDLEKVECLLMPCLGHQMEVPLPGYTSPPRSRDEQRER